MLKNNINQNINQKTNQLSKLHKINLNKSAIRYLNNYCEQEAKPDNLHKLLTLPQDYFHSALIIPAFKEDISLYSKLLSLPKINNPKINNKILIILIINAPDNASNSDIDINNNLIKHINNKTPATFNLSKNISYHKISDNHELLLINKILPYKQGVGLARKIANDIAFTLYTYKIIQKPWLYQTDADTTLPNDYFDYCETQIIKKNINKISACVFPFKHKTKTNNQDLIKAINLYEGYLNDYVKKLKYAKSPYAFHTLGSILAINADHYAQSAGFPKLSAGEDFYMLNKLAKIGEIKNLNLITNPIYIQARISDRTPFGTGPSLNKIINANKNNTKINTQNNTQNNIQNNNINILNKYSPVNKSAIESLKIIINIFNTPPESNLKIILNNPLTHSIYLQKRINNININNYPIWSILVKLGIENWLKKCPRNSNQKQLTHQYHQWFDGLKTLQFLKSDFD